MPCIKTYELTYHKGTGPEEQIRGGWFTAGGKATDGKTSCDPGSIILIRFDKPTFKPEPKLPPALTKRKAELVAEYKEKFANPYVAASRGYIDDVIEPKETRPRLINALEMLSNKRDANPAKKHGNIPL